MQAVKSTHRKGAKEENGRAAESAVDGNIAIRRRRSPRPLPAFLCAFAVKQ
jgi:hypothetical protein